MDTIFHYLGIVVIYSLRLSEKSTVATK